MQEPWGKVARWAGIGNNKEDGNLKGSAEGMAEDTMVKEMEEKELPAQSVTDVTPGSERADVAALKAELEQVRGERDQLLDRLARLQAEFENTRRREVKERQDARDYAVQNAVEPFLGVMDNFQLALKSDGTKQMEEALKGLNVQPVESVGTQFDPRIHEALGSIETTEFPDHQVLEEIRKGYRIRGKLLRPALVRIASNAAQKSE
jgi:molecular chaperone GrpE